jgi:hypothetical protein
MEAREVMAGQVCRSGNKTGGSRLFRRKGLERHVGREKAPEGNKDVAYRENRVSVVAVCQAGGRDISRRVHFRL